MRDIEGESQLSHDPGLILTESDESVEKEI